MAKKILVISTRAGWGHIRAAQALEEYARQNLPEINVKHVDLCEIEPRLGKFFEIFYDIASDYLPLAWGAVYQTFDKPPVSAAFRKAGGFHRLFRRRISNYLKRESPDGVIFTNVIPAPMVAPPCKKIFPHVPLAVVVTDYHGHSYYNVPAIDRYFAPVPEVKTDLARIGIPEDKIEVSGIPVGKKFYESYDREKIKKKLGIRNGFKTVVFVSRLSKEFIIPALEDLLALDPPINLITVCGGNAGLYRKIKEQIGRRKNFKLINWTARLDEYMKSADVVVGKPGGLIVSECLALKKKMVLIDPIPGQEERNAEFIERHGYGRRARNAAQIAALVRAADSQADKSFDGVDACAKILNYFR